MSALTSKPQTAALLCQIQAIKEYAARERGVIVEIIAEHFIDAGAELFAAAEARVNESEAS